MADIDIEELHTPTREWKGWIRNRMTHELEWCIITAGLMGVFRDPEADRARIVLNLADFDIKPLCEGAKRGSHVFTYVDDCYSIKFVSRRYARMIYTFGTETEDDFRTWYRALTGSDVEASGLDLTLDLLSSSSPGEVKREHNDARRMDSGLGEELSPGASQDAQGTSSGARKFDTIQETEDVRGSLGSSGKAGNVTPESNSGKSGSSDSLSDSGQSNATTPDSELGDELPKLRTNAHKLRVSRTEQSRFSAPVGDFSLWEEVMGEDGALTKTYSLPMKSPHHVRASSDGEEGDAFEYEPSSTKSTPGQQPSRSATTTPTYRRPGPVTSYSDPSRKKLGSRMTVKASKLVGRMTHLRSQRHKAPLPQSSLVNITVEGDLLRKHKSSLVPCFCILSGNVIYCYKSKDSDELSDLTIDVYKYRLSKLTAAKTESKELDCAFVLTPHSGSKEYVFIAKDLDVARKWYGHLEDLLKELETRQIRAMQNSAPDLRGSLPLLNQGGKYAVSQQSKYTKSKTRGSTFKRLAIAEEEKRNSIAARMSRASFEDGYGFTEEMSRHRASMDDIIEKGSTGVQADDYEEDAFIEITMDDVLMSKVNNDSDYIILMIRY
ncbi:uncharacterized protein LOC121427471 [Lytechinus variegatus]|uniref:uncharacterized protein LOC121427471 n=1 Tax=Lytechinus variegatus TaxID=7654 RepID=UPI001BB1EED9|nr:uncharacterized protein LOC121427471 [Lytechinus variegatus]XP_041479807.1 uncharacterized protein LOC121427471 [Lytechinus variegatus]